MDKNVVYALSEDKDEDSFMGIALYSWKWKSFRLGPWGYFEEGTDSAYNIDCDGLPR